MHRSNGLQLLHSLAEASSVAPLATQELEVTLPVLTSKTAALILSAFPRLERLRVGLWEPGEVYRERDEFDAAFAATLQRLLDRERGIPHLSFLDLERAPNTPDVRRALSGATQLTGLKLPAVRTEVEAQAIAPLTSLRSLDLWCYDAPILGALLSPLTALTSLRLRGDGHLSPALAGLPRLASLDYSTGHLDVSVLATLTALTWLSVRSLALPAAAGDAFEALAAPAHRHPWQLPPGLTHIELTRQPPEALHALRSSPMRKLTWFIDELELEGKTHLDYYRDDDGDVAADLTPHGEAALCAVAEFLAGRMADDSWIGMVCTAEHRVRPIRCVGGPEEAGPGRRNHTPWLEAFGRAGVPQLELDCFTLSYQDFEALAGHTGLKVLQLGEYIKYPLPALLSLPLMSSLERLELSADLWCRQAVENGEDAGGSDDDSGDPDGDQEPRARARAAALPPDLPGVLSALLCLRRRLRLILVHNFGPSKQERRLLTALVADVNSRVERLGGDSTRLEARDW
ncbi:hypothetical protein HYH03_019076 [Edaphochlamys debaryana]|uniref:Uncharacterized protein n=1 Tax=Edaphochlamys debaryana TaxID=47281 RepID=A0A835XKH8_9CHLO|nr:hypothetical protein HYH03_019076 [Edaphochlamys debaryana]|eukprot:KAG2481969.1 hypothetical protein HYH03_019076 [Edaphochlamys debaryana]